MKAVQITVAIIAIAFIAAGAILTPAWIDGGRFFSSVGAAAFQMYGSGIGFLMWSWLLWRLARP